MSLRSTLALWLMVCIAPAAIAQTPGERDLIQERQLPGKAPQQAKYAFWPDFLALKFAASPIVSRRIFPQMDSGFIREASRAR